MQGIQEILNSPSYLRLQERIKARMAQYTPDYYRERLPELEQMGATDEMIMQSQIPLYDRIKQLQDCEGCTGYLHCKRPPGMEGLVYNIDLYNDHIVTTQSMCDKYHEYIAEKRWQRLQEFSGKASQDHEYTFDNFPDPPKRLNKEICAAFYEFANNYHPGDKTKGIYLWGRAGAYKTWLMLALVNRLEQRRIPVLFIRTDAIFRNFKGYLNRKEPIDPIIETYGSVQVLAIDEFAQESATDFTVEVMFEIINARYTNGLPTFYTSNYDPEKVYERAVRKHQLEEKVEAIRRRIMQGSRTAYMKSDDWRKRDVETIGGPLA